MSVNDCCTGNSDIDEINMSNESTDSVGFGTRSDFIDLRRTPMANLHE